MALPLKSQSDLPSPADVLSFWKAAGYDRWYTKDEAFDIEIRQRFLATWEAARDSWLDAWQDSDAGTLALLIVLDQFPRNLFRGDPRAFSTDAKARDVARRGLAEGRDRRIDPVLRQFFYLPFEHRKIMPISSTASHCSATSAMPRTCATPKSTRTLSTGSAAFRIAMPCSAGRRPTTSRPFSTRADSPDDAFVLQQFLPRLKTLNDRTVNGRRLPFRLRVIW
jgi:uncharacterized protein (DUF924 family)